MIAKQRKVIAQRALLQAIEQLCDTGLEDGPGDWLCDEYDVRDKPNTIEEINEEIKRQVMRIENIFLPEAL